MTLTWPREAEDHGDGSGTEGGREEGRKGGREEGGGGGGEGSVAENHLFPAS